MNSRNLYEYYEYNAALMQQQSGMLSNFGQIAQNQLGASFYHVADIPITIKEEKVFSIYSELKGYIKNHKEVIFTIIAVLLADKYLLNGALRQRVTRLVEALLTKAEKAITPGE